MMKSMKTCLLHVLLLLIAVPVLAQEKVAPPQKFEREGVEVEFTIEPIKEPGQSSELMEAKEAVVRFKIHDKASKTPLSGVKPSVWLTQQGDGGIDENQCREQIES